MSDVDVPFTCMAFRSIFDDTRRMGLWRRLDAVDRRFVARRNGRYDRPPPPWVALSPLISVPLVVAILAARDGGWAILAAVAAAIACCLYFTAVFRWDRRHRVQ